MTNQKVLLLKTLVGSQAQGLATPESDFDYRGVFITPTEDILSINANVQTTTWIEGKDDDTAWEIGHFLQLATKCNPTILEVFLSPIVDISPGQEALANELRDLFPYVWNSQYVRDAFIGYGHNQRKKMIEDKDLRRHKYAVAYLRTLYQAAELLKTGTFTVDIGNTEFGEYLKKIKNKDASISLGDIINKAVELEADVNAAYEQNPNKNTDMSKINEFLLKVRRLNFQTR